MKTQSKFVQGIVPRWIASLPENAMLLAGHQCIGQGESTKTRSAVIAGNSEVIRVISPLGGSLTRRPCMDWSGHLPGGRQPGNYSETAMSTAGFLLGRWGSSGGFSTS